MWKLTENFPDFTYWKSVFLDIFCPLLTLPLVALENLVWAHGPEPTWSLKIGSKSKIHILPNYVQTDLKTAIVLRWTNSKNGGYGLVKELQHAKFLWD